jgi:predicted acyl esterase
LGRTLLAVGVLTLILPRAAGAAPFSKQDIFVPMDDGVPIAATLYEPQETPPASGWPTVLLLHGLGQNRASPGVAGLSPHAVAETWLAGDGYAVLTFDARAHGQSGGVSWLDGPREIEDVRSLYDWLSARPEIDRTRIGAVGLSYGGGAVWRAAVEGVPFATIVPAATWTDLAAALFPNGLVKAGAVAGLVAGLPRERMSPALVRFSEGLLRNESLDRLKPFAALRSSRTLLDRLQTPVFMLQGRRDFTFDLGQVFAAYTQLRAPKRLYLGDFGHAPATNPPAEQAHYLGEIKDWLDRFLKGERNGILSRPPIEVASDPWTGKTVSYRRIPPRRAVRLKLPGNATLGPAGKVIRSVALPRRQLEVFGAPVVALTASTTSSWDHVVAVLSALTRQGKEIVVSEGGAATPMLSRQPRTIALPLIDTAAVIPAGSRLRVTLAATSTARDLADLLYPLGVAADARITIRAVRVTLPVLATPISP